ncbi:MAG: creatinine amidohydrolase [Acidobacteriota bacterium]|jgi:creatinine amidohydrolase
MRLPFVVVLAFAAAATARSQGAPPERKGVRLADITWQQAADVLGPETVVVIPLGAGSKEHGPHLKLGNDAILADYLTRRVLEASKVVVAPALPYHFYPAFTEYPGSTSLTLDTARALTTEAARAVSRFGPRRFYVLNTGVSTTRALEPAAAVLASEGLLLRYTDLTTQLDRASALIRQEEGGTHADEVETSMMLYIDPASVDMTRAVKEFSPSSGALHLTRRRGADGTFSESGVWGDPTLATREKGRVIVESLIAGILADIDAIRRATPPVPGGSAVLGAGAVPSRSAMRMGPAAPGTCTPGDERSIRGMGDALTLHWHNADATQLAALWSSEGDVVHPDGLTERSRETIRANRAALFLRREYRGSAHPVTLGPVRCIGPDVAVADGRWEMRGVTDAGGAALPTFEGLVTLVLSRAGGGWSIEAYRYTQKPAAAALPTWLKRPGYPGGV